MNERLRADRICAFCACPVTGLTSADGTLLLIDPDPHPLGRWQVSVDRSRVRLAGHRPVTRYALHREVCAAKDFGRTYGPCRARTCPVVVVLYGPKANLLCPECQRKLDGWRRAPAATRGPFPL